MHFRSTSRLLLLHSCASLVSRWATWCLLRLPLRQAKSSIQGHAYGTYAPPSFSAPFLYKRIHGKQVVGGASFITFSLKKMSCRFARRIPSTMSRCGGAAAGVPQRRVPFPLLDHSQGERALQGHAGRMGSPGITSRTSCASCLAALWSEHYVPIASLVVEHPFVSCKIICGV